jgi:hypothetical protein
VPDIFLYALTSARAGRPALRGICGEPLRAVRIGRLDVIIGHVRARPKPTDANLRKYNRLMGALWLGAPALLPARFGTTMNDISELELLVRARLDVLRSNLRMVRGRAQMTVRMADLRERHGEPRFGVRERGSGGLTSRGVGAEYLRARAAEERRAREVPAFAPCRAAVQRWVKAERVEKTAGVATIYHLVPRGAAARYATELQRAASEAGLRMIVSGPWPPYAFADSW